MPTASTSGQFDSKAVLGTPQTEANPNTGAVVLVGAGLFGGIRSTLQDDIASGNEIDVLSCQPCAVGNDVAILGVALGIALTIASGCNIDGLGGDRDTWEVRDRRVIDKGGCGAQR